MPLRIAPSPSLQEVIEKLEELEKLIILEKAVEPVKKRVVNKAETPSLTKTTLTILTFQTVAGKKCAVEIFVNGEHYTNIILGITVGEEEQVPCTFIVKANQTWEAKTIAGFETPEIYSTYIPVGGMGSKGEKGETGEKGATGPEGPKGGILTLLEIEEKLKELKQALVIAKEIKATSFIATTEVNTPTIKGLTNLTLTGGSFDLEKEKFYLGPVGGIDFYTVPENETINTAEQATLKQVCVVALKATAERIIYGAKPGATRGKLLILYNTSTFNLVLENESALEEATKKPEGSNEQFKFSTKANITLKPGESIWLYGLEVATEAATARWIEIGGSAKFKGGPIESATSGDFSTTLKVKETVTFEGALKGKAIEGTSGTFTTTLKVKETLTAEGEVKVEKTLKVKELTTCTGGLTVEATLTLPAESITETFIKKEAVSKAKLAKAVQEELLTVAAFPGLAAYTSAKEETETKPTFITMLITYKAEAVAGKVKLVNDGKEVVIQRLGTATAIKELIHFLVKKEGKWKATLEGSVEKMEIARQVINSV